MNILVIGSTGYIGSNLIERLKSTEHTIYASSRNMQVIENRDWHDVNLIYCDLFDSDSIESALQNIDVVFYFVHSMAAGSSFDSLDREAANNFRQAVDKSSVQQIVYLGGLQPISDPSKHLSSRKETGDILRQSNVPVTELRAGVVVGAGSAGFEMIRDLVYHLRFMITPKWVRSMTQPIALRDLLEYLVQVIGNDATYNDIFDVAGTSTIRYQDMLKEFANVVGRPLVILPVPLISPRLSSYWLDFVTAVPKDIAKPLIYGLRNDLIGDNKKINKIIDLPLMSYTESIQKALEDEQNKKLSSRWTENAIFFKQYNPENSFFSKEYKISVKSDMQAESIWSIVSSLGGKNGWYYMNWLWKIRGILDRLIGGIGTRRGRRHPSQVRVGDTIDFFRVGEVDDRNDSKSLVLLAEMKVPGAALLEFKVNTIDAQTSEFITTARFHPSGTIGLLYWYILLPIHSILFKGMAKGILKNA